MTNPNYADWQIPMFHGLIAEYARAAKKNNRTRMILVEETTNNLIKLYPEAWELNWQQYRDAFEAQIDRIAGYPLAK